MRRLFYRNISARDQLELFFVSAISSLLLLRFILYKAGYPQVGGGSLHIAHMLYGGLLMMIAIVVLLSYIGMRAQRFAALIGGIGFGIFIDELGKFITKDNNYFFRPTIGIIYAIFVILYLAFNFISRHKDYTSEEYQLNALQGFNEVILKDLDRHEKSHVKALLKKADQDSPVTEALNSLINEVKLAQASKGSKKLLQNIVARKYDNFWKQRHSNKIVSAIFILEALIFLFAILGNLVNGFDSINDLFRHTDKYSTILLIGQFLSSAVVAIFTIIGAFKLVGSRLEALENFHRAVLVNILLTEFFIFSRIQFHAIAGFLVNLVLLIALQSALHHERRILASQ